ncbi:putative peptidase [Pelotomaculum schinkii]|uniref:Putative peptidase n=1 Tax=Pelotomaculum schinkii TaxID=78350 RepID=A0A4Y7RCF0_9FIRM|nr:MULTISPECIES: Xaa-Pro peptidase family protein [Pelotomaculum]TEB05997.1 putative peptidase [Pelotomaculum schinkii]TEB13930.1 putative peptidase [Pelotomaculum sp. FP]
MTEQKQTSCTPREELYERIGKFQERLRKAGIQAALVVQKADLFYFSGTCQDAHLLIPTQGEPLLMVRKSYERALEDSALEKIIAVRSFKDIGSNIAGMLTGNGKIGMELDVLPVNLFSRYKKMLEPLEIVDVSGVIREIRMIKTPYEIDCLRDAASLTAEMFAEIPNFIEEGMTEIELSGKIELFLRVRGNQYPRIRAFNQELSIHILSGWNAAYPSYFDGPTGGSGVNSSSPIGSGYKKIGRNEPILIDYGPVLNGYMVDHTRIYSFGPLSDKLMEAHNTALEIKRRIAREAKPGLDGKDLYDIAIGMAEQSGFAQHFMGYGVSFIGHGVGLELDELPVIARNYSIKMQPGMTIALEPKFIFPDEGTVGIEDTFLVTENGLEPFIPALDDAIQIL